MNVACSKCSTFMESVAQTFVRIGETIWSADRCSCPRCGSSVVAGFQGAPVADLRRHGEEHFSKWLPRVEVQIKDNE